ncbi:serine/threonine-protein kinase [Nonomuraea glycinis]|uniref:serine/threonine-protein kinase n=1 Tax=Nonomuraea glycinis TaxID=2047744 RepID=UPI002E103301|nr:serine/threonine protein kinase [Nonomuraea glycinis]
MMPPAIGPYRLIRQLGEGGQGVVYLGTAPDGTLVAVKALREGVAGDGRFAKEIAAARRVEPFCVAQVLDASLGGRPYIVTEYVEGPSLQQAGRHAGADLQRLAVATATALAAIHRAGVVHRDFKPANVLLGRDGPRVIDFGIARAMDDALTATSSVIGTPAYMAPEQLAGQPVGPPTDVFAWACVMVYAAAGAPPFGNDSLPAVITRIQYAEPWLGEVPEPLRSILSACLAKDPAARPTMQDVLFQLISGRAAAPTSAPLHRYGAAQPSPSGPAPSPSEYGPPSGPSGPAPDGTHPTGYGPPPSETHPSSYGPPPGNAHPHAPRTAPPHGYGSGSAYPHGYSPARAASRNRGGLALLAGGTALVVTGAVVAAWVWLPMPFGRPTTVTLDTSPSPTTTTKTSGATTPKRSPKHRSPHPTRTATTTPPSSRPTTARPTTASPTTAAPTTTRPRTTKPAATAGGGVTSVAFSVEGIRVGDCWRSDANLYAKVTATGSYSYRWLLNGRNQGRQAGGPSSKPLLPSIAWDESGGTHRVVFEVVSPTSSQKSITMKICAPGKGWGYPYEDG